MEMKDFLTEDEWESEPCEKENGESCCGSD